MKPYQFYVVRKMPLLENGQSVHNQVQMTISGENEDIETTVEMKMRTYNKRWALMRIQSSIRHNTMGYIKTLVESTRRTINFYEYLEPVDFSAYYDEASNLIIFQAPKKVCSGVLGHLKDGFAEIELAEMSINFAEVLPRISEYLGAWFTGVSSRVNAAGLSGNQIQNDSLFKNLVRVASLSNVTIPWKYKDAEHRVMITSRAGVVLVQNYKKNASLELEIASDVHEKLLKHVWQERHPASEEDNEDTGIDKDL